MHPIRYVPPRARAAHALVLTTLALAVAACAGQPPNLLTIQERTVGVNEPLDFDVAATDADTEKLTFTMRDAPKGATLSEVGGRLAKFRWTPTPAQVGLTTLTFIASDGASTDEETVNIRVVNAGTPRFTESAYRYVVNPLDTNLVKITLDVRDDDSPDVFFAYDPHPEDWGAEVSESPKRTVISWEPTEDQKKQAQWTFRVTATDSDENASDAVVTVVFRGGGTGSECPTGKSEPTVEVATIDDQSGPDDYPVLASVEDADSDITDVAVLYSLDENPDETGWKHEILQTDGSGLYEGVIPNPGLPPGESGTVTWMVCAYDDDDPDGIECDNLGCSATQTFVATGVDDGGGLCDPATTNRDTEPETNSWSGAPCLTPLPQTIPGTLALHQADTSRNDARDLFLVQGVPGKWLLAKTAAGAAPELGDTVLRLYSDFGVELAMNDDDETGTEFTLYSRIAHRFTDDAIYFLEVVPYSNGTDPVSGGYSLAVSISGSEPPPSP